MIPCLVCGSMPCDTCHIQSRGAGGCDEPWNIVFMCRRHHSEQHSMGWDRFAGKYSWIKRSLREKGWEWISMGGYRRPFHSKSIQASTNARGAINDAPNLEPDVEVQTNSAKESHTDLINNASVIIEREECTS
jgi:hypothetical protein